MAHSFEDDDTRVWLRPGSTHGTTGVLAIRPYSCRHLLFAVCFALLSCVALPYLLLASEHADSCYIVRSAVRMRLEEAAAEQRILNVTAGVAPPALEAIESSPEGGRARSPSLFYQHQTAIMIALLAACLIIKLLYALRHMRPTTVVTSHDNAQQLEMGAFTAAGDAGSQSVRRPKSRPSSKSNTPTRSTSSDESTGANSARFEFHWWEIFRLLYGYLWYLAAYFLCNALKSILGDTSCSTHGNSVSGHYLFFCFALFTVAYLHLSQKHLHAEPVLTAAFWRRLAHPRHLHGLDCAFLCAYLPFVCVCLSILCDTYTGGFHSLRQIIYGFAMAVAVFLALTGVLESVEERLSRRHQRAYAQVKGLALEPRLAHQQAANPALSSAYLPFVSGLLHESFYVDERAQRFYLFPLVALFAFQLTAWLALASSPTPGYFRWPDIGAVVLGSAALVWIWHARLRPSTRR